MTSVASFRDACAEHYEDAGSLLTARVGSRLRTDGLLTFDGLRTRANVVAASRMLLRMFAHPDSEGDGLTAIRDLGADRRGRAGLGNGAVAAHTDQAQNPVPPRLLFIACITPAATGGASMLTDGRAVYETLASEDPEALDALGSSRAAFFGAGAGHSSAIFRRNGDRVTLRLRQDELARFAPAAEPHLPALRAAIQAHTLGLTLRPGQAYLLDNHRWLHARTAFTGNRELLRALGDPVSLIALPDGFPVARAEAACSHLS
jgi:hypothetical protein